MLTDRQWSQDERRAEKTRPRRPCPNLPWCGHDSKRKAARGLGTKPGGFETDVSRIIAKQCTSVSDGDLASSGVNGMVVLTGGQCLAPLLCSVRFCELVFACLGRAQSEDGWRGGVTKSTFRNGCSRAGEPRAFAKNSGTSQVEGAFAKRSPTPSHCSTQGCSHPFSGANAPVAPPRRTNQDLMDSVETAGVSQGNR